MSATRSATHPLPRAGAAAPRSVSRAGTWPSSVPRGRVPVGTRGAASTARAGTRSTAGRHRSGAGGEAVGGPGILGKLAPARVAGLVVARAYAAMPAPRARADGGMSTAEYAVGTVAACGFAALLFKILTSSKVRSLIVNLVTRALNLAG